MFVRSFKFNSICCVLGIIVFIMFVEMKYRSERNYRNRSNDDRWSIEKQRIMFVATQVNNDNRVIQQIPTQSPMNSYDSMNHIEKIIEEARFEIKSNLSKYNFSHSGVHRLEDLLTESGGQPIRTLVTSSWSSGSTFLGELLESVPGTHYHWEPLQKDGMIQIRTPAQVNRAVANLKKMFKCNFVEMEDYFEFLRTHENVTCRNTRLWNHCKHKKDVCIDAEFVSRFCKLCPFQLMKTCRMRLRFVQEILDDEELNVKVILLVRDPRGVFNSRRQRVFCQWGLDCSQPDIYCADLIRDYITVNRLIPLYPGRVMALRYEDLALNTYATTQRIFKFLKLSYTKSTEEFLKSHTNKNEAFETFRVSSSVPFKWRYLMDYKDVEEIQLICKGAMKLWGYKMTYSDAHMKSPEFYPLENYKVTERTNN